MFRHLVDGGSWVAKSGKRIRAGNDIQAYMRDDPKFRSLYLGEDREYVDNSESPKTIKKGIVGYFQDRTTNHSFLGRVIRANKETVQVKKLVHDMAASADTENQLPVHYYAQLFPRSLYTNARKDIIGNPIVRVSREDPITRSPLQITLLDIVDVQASYYRFSQQWMVVNISKFGTLWRLLQTDIAS